MQKALELARTEKLIGGSLDAKVTLYGEGDTLAFLRDVESQLPAVLIVSAVEVAGEGAGAFTGEVEGLSVTVARADGDKCDRCWVYSDSVGQDAEHPTLCGRCAAIMRD